MPNLTWIPPTAVAGVGVVVSALSFRMLRRQNQGVGWALTIEPGTRPVFVVTRVNGPAVKHVRAVVEGAAAPSVAVVERLDPGGHLSLRPHIAAVQPLTGVLVEWDGWFGRRKKWRSGI